MWVHALRDATPACGGKAMGLRRLIEAGLPVPDGFAIESAAFEAVLGDVDVERLDGIGERIQHAVVDVYRTRALPEDFARDVEARARALVGGSDVEMPRAGIVAAEPHLDADEQRALAVRSSATIEDGAAGSAAGVFSSFGAVRLESLWSMIRAVWASSLTPLAAAYGRQRGREATIGVIVQRFVPGTLVTIYTRAPGSPESPRAMIQRDGAQARPIDRTSDDRLLALALRAEAAIGAVRGADVEIIDGVEPRVVQARPIVHPASAPRTPVPPSVIASLVEDGRLWRLDLAHNPDPLSPAQGSLVDRVEAAGVSPFSMRVCAGYIYTAEHEPPKVQVPTTVEELFERSTILERRLAETLAVAEVPPLAEAIERYLQFYRIWANELSPLIASARAGFAAAQIASHRPSAVESVLLSAARGDIAETEVFARIGMLAPAWDVAVPTYGERPQLLRDAIVRAKQIPTRTTVDAPPSGRTPDIVARAAADLAERDDLLFARAQWLVRNAILAHADQRGFDRDDVFWIRLEDLVDDQLTADDIRRRASGARAAGARTASWAMPCTIGIGTRPPTLAELAATEPARALRGVGTGPRVTGRIVRFATLASTVAISAGDIVVARAVTPALAVQVIGCAALISETGGLLDHGAALARELSIPCVVGCSDAWSLLRDGMVVTVDGDAGTVEIAA